MFKIGDFSRLAQVSVRTLRYYGELGLLEPAWIDRFSGYRYYTAEQLPRLNRILALKDLGFSLDQVRRLLQADLPAGELRGMLRLKQADLERQLQAEQARLERVEARLRQIEREGALPDYEVVLKSLPALPVAGLRRKVPDPTQVGLLFEELQGVLRSSRLPLDPAAPWLAVYYDPEYRDQGLDVEAAAPLQRLLPASDPLKSHLLPAVETMACAIHHGPYARLGEAYNALLTWVETNGYRVAGPNREIYLQGPDTAGLEQAVTEVQLPVQSKSFTLSLSRLEEQTIMEPKIVAKPAFIAVGMLYYGKNEHNEISQMWDVFGPRIQEIQHITDGAFGLCRPADESGQFEYLASMAVSEASHLPEGMLAWEVPAQTYAVFTTTLPQLKEAYRYAFETWLPGSGYEYTKGVDFEYYDETFDAESKKSEFTIYIPIRPVK